MLTGLSDIADDTGNGLAVVLAVIVGQIEEFAGGLAVVEIFGLLVLETPNAVPVHNDFMQIDSCVVVDVLAIESQLVGGKLKN